jgi:hypothetical protein
MGVWTPGQVRAILQRAAGRYWASNEGVFEMRGLRQSWRLGGLVEVAGRLAPETDQKLFARPANEPEPARLLDGKGDKMAEELDYVPMPDNVVNAVKKLWVSEIKDASGKPIFWGG